MKLTIWSHPHQSHRIFLTVGACLLALGIACLLPARAAGASSTASGWTYTDQHDFGGTVTNADGQNGPDGNLPQAGVTIDADGNMYGTTSWGGANDAGMVWKITSSGGYADLHDFGGTVTNADGQSGTDGAYPFGGVTIDADGNLYGTALYGGANDAGMVWQIPSSASYVDLHDFGGTVTNADGQSGPDGSFPYAGVAIDAEGNLYGTTYYGGADASNGMVWNITSSGSYVDLHDFGGTVTNADGQSGSDGKNPYAGVTIDANVNMYGTTEEGGANDAGMVWQIPSSASYVDLHDFGGTVTNADGQTGPDGQVPFAGVTIDADGNMYGTASAGATGGGMVWKIVSSGGYVDLHDFGGTVTNADGQSGPDGANPHAGVTIDAGGNMYGTTPYGGANGANSYYGTVWQITSSGTYVDLHDFGGTVTNADDQSGPDGFAAYAGVTIDTDGNLYGTTYDGGANSLRGIVYRLQPPGYALVVNTTEDSTDPQGSATVSLRDAINYANANPGSTITFLSGLSGTITLASALPQITASMTIQGNTSSLVAVDGNNQQYRPFDIDAAGASVTIANLTVQNGSDQVDGNGGGGILLGAGTLNLNDCNISDNGSYGNDGGGGLFIAGGAVSLNNCIVSGNSAHGSGVLGDGGGILNFGSATLTDCTVSDNTATSGGGVFNGAYSTATFTNCTMSDNSVSNGGGGVVNRIGTYSLTNCTLSGNNAANDGGGLIIEDGGTSTLINCTLSGNTAADGGGIECNAVAILINCTLSRNTATDGGGIYGNGMVTNCILYGDAASSDGNEVYDAAGGVSAAYSDIEGGVGGDTGITDDGGNIDSDPLLGTLAYNGGPTETMALGSGSPCYGAGTPTGAPVTDQRGVTRPDPPSIGAYDYNGTPTGTAATPEINPDGGTVPSGQQVTITDGTAGATNYYTTDGTDPSASSTAVEYSGSLTVSTGETINVVAVALGYYGSTVASATFVVNPPAATPVLSPPPGSYAGSVGVTITDATSGATIYYTLDGSTPTALSAVYPGSLNITATTTVSAIAAAAGYSNSAVGTATYSIVAPGSRLLQAQDASSSADGTVVVPITLVAQGDENTISASLTFDPTVLTYSSAALGADATGARLTLNTTDISTGSLGFTVALPEGQTFAAGTRQVLVVTFTTITPAPPPPLGIRPAAASSSTVIGWSNQPVAQAVMDVNNNSLSTGYTPALVAPQFVGYEGDVLDRGSVDLSDWVYVGRIVVGLAPQPTGLAYQAADCSPRANMGSGQPIGLADWVQTGRYVVGLDPLTPVGGPTAVFSP